MKRKINIVLKSIIYLIDPTSYKKTVWLIGSARSGTTWVSSLINYRNSFRELFEPFHTKIFQMKLLGFEKNHYLKNNRGLRVLAKVILRGKFYHPRVERTNRSIKFYNNDFLIVKDIYANLLAYEMCSNDDRIKPILLIRNPFAVALSCREKKHWDWMADAKVLLSQKELYEDYLKPFEKLIIDVSTNGSYLDKRILIWSIVNYIPLMQFTKEKLLITFYEDWILNPNQELLKVYKYLNIPHTLSEDLSKSNIFTNPSWTSTKKKYTISAWKGKLSSEEIDSGNKILRRFGLDKIYDELSVPNKNIIQHLMHKTK